MNVFNAIFVNVRDDAECGVDELNDLRVVLVILYQAVFCPDTINCLHKLLEVLHIHHLSDLRNSIRGIRFQEVEHLEQAAFRFS